MVIGSRGLALRSAVPKLGKKQANLHADFVHALEHACEHVSERRIDELVKRTAEEVYRVTGGRRVAYAWSGGKDSLALEYVMRAVGVASCVLVVCNLEMPSFLEWVAVHRPRELVIVNTGQGLDWLAAHPEMLFPADANTAGKWFRVVQHRGQEKFSREHSLDFLMLGRRRADGNYLGEKGIYKTRGCTRYSPIREWTHEEVFALIRYKNIALPPVYDWPRGFRVGTGPWAKRRVPSHDAGFDEVWAIDPSIIRGAAAHPSPIFDGARACVARHETQKSSRR